MSTSFTWSRFLKIRPEAGSEDNMALLLNGDRAFFVYTLWVTHFLEKARDW